MKILLRSSIRGAQISAADFKAELVHNPTLAASLTLPNGGDSDPPGVEGGPGIRALKELLRRRHRRHGDGRSSNSDVEESLDDSRDGNRAKLQQQTATTTISWPEFVDAFIPLGEWGWDGAENAEPQQKNAMGDGAAMQDPQKQGAGEEKAGEGGMIEQDEMQLLRVAFAATAIGAKRAGGGNQGEVVSLAELRAASALLDGEEPPEEPVRKALEVNTDVFSCHSPAKTWNTVRQRQRQDRTSPCVVNVLVRVCLSLENGAYFGMRDTCLAFFRRLAPELCVAGVRSFFEGHHRQILCSKRRLVDQGGNVRQFVRC